MASDAPPPQDTPPPEAVQSRDTSALARLTALLTDTSDTAPTARELAELLWLARELEAPAPMETSGDPNPDPDANTDPNGTVAPPPLTQVAPEERQSAPQPPSPTNTATPTPTPTARVPLHLPTPHPPTDDTLARTATRHLLAPAPPMLPHPLALQRALRPLKRTVASARARLLDERATADRIARLGAHPDVWLPVLRPARDRWLRLSLVHDTGPTMPVWRPLVRELHTALAQSGVFRAITLHPATPDGRARHVPDPADGRTVTLVVSDCMGPQWRPGPAGDLWYATLRHWATRMPLAVVQPLPERLWPTTALPAEPGLLSSPTTAAPLAALTFTPYDPEAEPAPAAAFPLPVLEPGAPWLANWAALVAGPGGGHAPGAAAWLPPAPTPPSPAEPGTPDPASLPAQDLVLRFRATASPEAFRLAGHLALAVPSVPVMRLVQRAVNRDPRPQHLAEVILSGMLTTAPGPPGSYDFRPGVRDLLLRTLPRTTRGRTRELLDRIGGLIDDQAGYATGGFPAQATTPEANGTDAHADSDTAPAFARVSEETVQRLAGDGEEPPVPPVQEPDGPLHIRMLGPLHISRSPEPLPTSPPASLPLPSPEAQALLCMLLLAPGPQATTYDDLATGLWEQPPGSVESVRRIDALAREVGDLLGPARLTRTPDGYTLDTTGTTGTGTGIEVDAVVCEDVLAHPHQDPQTQRARLEHALALFHGDPLDGLPGPAARESRSRLRSLRDSLRTALATHHPAILFETDADLVAHPETRITLELAVHEVLTRGDLTPQQYEVRVRRNGYVVQVHPEAYFLPVLAAALRWLPGPLATVADRTDVAEPPCLRVTFRSGPAPAPAPPKTTAPVLLTIPPALYDDFAHSSAASGPHRFRPLYGDAPDGPPLAWYCRLPAPRPEDGTGDGGTDDARDLVRGPLLTPDLRQLGIPAPGRTAIVHTGPDGPLTLLNPADPYGGHATRAATYYEVDLTPHHAVRQTTLPSSGKGAFTAAVELTWRVADPVAYVRAYLRASGPASGEAGAAGVAERLMAHLVTAAARVTGHHSVRRAAGAQRAVNAQLGRWPVPGLAVTCAVTLAPDYAPPPEVRRPTAPAARPLAGLLADAETVLFGFDGPLTRLFTANSAREAALDLLALVAEHRHPEDALTGQPLGGGGARRELFVHPLDVLRAFAHDPLGPLLRDRLDELELRAVPDAPTTHHSVTLVRTLHDSGRRVGVATDVSTQAVHRYLESHPLPLARAHCRSDDISRLMPHPDCLLRALRPHGTPALTSVLIGATLPELTAAQQVGLRFIGLARNPTVEASLREAGCEVTVPSLAPVLEAALNIT
ncbi:Phosphoglycolate phosphatase, HAD superfamily [Streptomyces sp. yr375]|uniref:SAV_2336 N-terminal domain-related protein n=1 Tax=Streptomyces sp. yr375 TaxID=1761906 RepID=UPI0008B7BA75|nr:SAV_2336 N-terminal domain-related protein [Streptomyces sp. yr375]SER87460.1 Phosphoglycolate phosphatase, HAD superfamily [Streptomyces sp. yr375]